MIFNVKKIINFLSQGTTLLPGDIIMTGTPEGIPVQFCSNILALEWDGSLSYGLETVILLKLSLKMLENV